MGGNRGKALTFNRLSKYSQELSGKIISLANYSVKLPRLKTFPYVFGKLFRYLWCIGYTGMRTTHAEFFDGYVTIGCLRSIAHLEKTTTVYPKNQSYPTAQLYSLCCLGLGAFACWIIGVG